MNKKKILLPVTVTSMIAITGAVLTFNGGLKRLSVFATNGEVWYHYAAVAPTETTHGSKEFWASSANGCATHQFSDPGVECKERDFSTYESFATLTCDDDRYVPSGNESLGITPMFSAKNKTVTYGLYPQTYVGEELNNSLNELSLSPESNGWYLYDGEYYAKVSATCEFDFTFDNGTTIENGVTYWFKCEPISWTILTNDYVDADGKHLGYYLLSNVLLDAHRYDDNSNDYKDSEIRSFLENDFYNSAFALGNSYIQTTTIDNSANIQDKVFLPSYQDYNNSDYGFDASDTRSCKTTDWVRARGAYCETEDPSCQYNGDYWTLSTDSGDPTRAWYVTTSGDFYRWYVNYTDQCVRPSLSIKIA